MRKKTVLQATCFLVLFYLGISLLRIIYLTTTTPSTIDDNEFDVIILLGQGVKNGSLLPDENRRDIHARLDLALTLFQQQTKKPTIILSGYGRGYRYRAPENQEALVMYAALSPQLRQLGYNPKHYLLLENQSHHTIENAIYSKKILSSAERVLVFAPAKSYQRTDLIFSTILTGKEVTIYSLTPQTKGERNVEWLRTAGTVGILLLPEDTIRLTISKYLFPASELLTLAREFSRPKFATE